MNEHDQNAMRVEIAVEALVRSVALLSPTWPKLEIRLPRNAWLGVYQTMQAASLLHTSAGPRGPDGEFTIRGVRFVMEDRR